MTINYPLKLMKCPERMNVEVDTRPIDEQYVPRPSSFGVWKRPLPVELGPSSCEEIREYPMLPQNYLYYWWYLH